MLNGFNSEELFGEAACLIVHLTIYCIDSVTYNLTSYVFPTPAVPISLSFCENHSAAVVVSIESIMGKPAPFFHEHYTYRMKFNNIQKRNCNSRCNLREQKLIIVVQASTEYWKRLWRDKKNEDYIAFSRKTQCTMVDTNVESIPASRATAGRSYRLNCVPTAEALGLSVNLSNFTTCNMDFFPLACCLLTTSNNI